MSASLRDAMSQNGSPETGPKNSGDGAAWSIVSYLLSGLIFWGGAGWLLDHWLGTKIFLLVGLLLGAVASLYLVWLRYGKQ
jgi:ATP synthase protein I